MDRVWPEISAYYDCIESPGWGRNTYDETVTPRLLTSSLVSVSVFTSYECNRAPYDSYTIAINLDAHTAQPITLEDILWVGQGKPLHYVEGSDVDSINLAALDEYSSYLDNELRPWLIRQWKHLYPTKLLPTKNNADCDYSEAHAWQGAGYLTPAGIFMFATSSHADRVCETNDDWSVLPWRIVRQHPGWLGLTLPK